MGNQQPVVSIIIPIYNVEPYLRCCLNSILAQTFQSWEAVLVDDGSKDNCGKICDEYAAMDSRFRVIHKENGGLTSARNAGLAMAFGEWVMPLDGDDWIEPDMLEKMYAVAEKSQADIVYCDFYLSYEKNERYMFFNICFWFWGMTFDTPTMEKIIFLSSTVAMK